MRPRGERVTKGWRVVWRPGKGERLTCSRVYHSKWAADELAKAMLKAGYVDVDLRTIEGTDKISRGIA